MRAARLTILTLAAALACHAAAQPRQGRWTIEPRAGLTLYEFIGDEANGCRMRAGLSVGAEARVLLLDYMSVSGGLEYVPRGSGLKHMDGYLRQDHLSFPVLAHFHPFGRQLTLSLGVCPTVSLHSTLRVAGESWDSGQLFHGHDVMIPIGVSYTLRGGLTLGARMSAGRKTMVRRDATYRGARYNLRGAMVNNNEITVTVGYQISLKP